MTYSVERSRTMRTVKSWNTVPKMRLRKVLHGIGFRCRIHRRDLPDKPDIMFPSRREVVFASGYFWGKYDCVRGARKPKTNREYWQDKIARNMKWDHYRNRKLKVLGWDAMTAWECELQKWRKICHNVRCFLNVPRKSEERTVS